jgi:DNA repair protein RadA/Sms
VEERHSVARKHPFAKGAKGGVPLLSLTSLAETQVLYPRLLSGIAEFDRVCGGGLVAGSVLLVGGDPGIGKSTLLLQVAAQLSQQTPCCYISGEEAVDQIRMRAFRLGVGHTHLLLASATNLSDILATLKQGTPPAVVVIDSIQTIFSESIDSAPGSVSQVRLCTQELISFAKKYHTVIILVGHVTKEGTIAGPRVLEHMVDTVLYFEGERGHQFRLLRGVKNRFGATDEIGVFEMTHTGLIEVTNPSALFLSERAEAVSGSVVFAGMEGTRPLLVEIQALVAPTAFGTPRRAVIGWDVNRLAMVIAVLEARCGILFGMRDVYLNVAGGLKIQEPAADLAVAAALVSALFDQALPQETIFFGEISLSGEVRGVPQTEARLKEAAKLGFKHAVIPQTKGRSKHKITTGDPSHTFFDLQIDVCAVLSDIQMLFAHGVKPGKDKVYV